MKEKKRILDEIGQLSLARASLSPSRFCSMCDIAPTTLALPALFYLYFRYLRFKFHEWTQTYLSLWKTFKANPHKSFWNHIYKHIFFLNEENKSRSLVPTKNNKTQLQRVMSIILISKKTRASRSPCKSYLNPGGCGKELVGNGSGTTKSRIPYPQFTSKFNKKQKKKVISLEQNFFQFWMANNVFENFDKTD